MKRNLAQSADHHQPTIGDCARRPRAWVGCGNRTVELEWLSVRYPHTLIPTTYEEIYLLTGGTVSVPKAMPRFKPWLGAPLNDTYGGKQVIDSRGEPVFAELAILRLLQAEDWEGAWIDTYRNRKRIAIDQFIELPPNRNELLKQIYQSTGSRSGCFDVYCWHDKQILFAEAEAEGARSYSRYTTPLAGGSIEYRATH